MTQTSPINFLPNEYSQELRYYPSSVNLDRCAGSCDTLDDFSSRIRNSNGTEDLNLHDFNMTIWIKESKTLTRHISWKCECKFYSKNCNLNKKWNNNKLANVGVSEKIRKNIMSVKKDYIWNPATYSWENGKYSGINIGHPVIICNGIINTKKTIPIICSCYYFDDIIKFKIFDLDDVLIDEKQREHILVYKISYKTMIASKSFHSRFDGFLCILHIYIYIHISIYIIYYILK